MGATAGGGIEACAVARLLRHWTGAGTGPRDMHSSGAVLVTARAADTARWVPLRCMAACGVAEVACAWEPTAGGLASWYGRGISCVVVE